MKKISGFLFIILIICIALPHLSFAIEGQAVSCACYCGVSLPAPCGDEDCKRACGYHEPSGGGSGAAAAGALAAPLYNASYGLGQAIGHLLFGNPEEEARKKAEETAKAAKEARQAEIARQKAEDALRQRAAEEARKRQQMYDRLSSELQVSPNFDGGPGSGLDLMTGDPNDNLHPQGTSFFGQGGGTPSNNAAPSNSAAKVSQGYTATAAAPAGTGDALPLIMGDPNAVDLRPSTTSNSGGTVKPDCQWGNEGSSVVDLRCLGLDPNKPVAIDPHVVKGQERVFAAQVDPKLLEDPNYKKAMKEEMLPGSAPYAEAVRYFTLAQKGHPNDPTVRTALLMAEDIYKERSQKEKDARSQAALLTLQGYASMMADESGKAQDYIAQARKLDPDNNNIKFMESLARTNTGTYPRRKEAYKLVAGSLYAISKQNYPDAIGMLEAAQRLQPEDKTIGMFLRQMRNYGAGGTGKKVNE